MQTLQSIPMMHVGALEARRWAGLVFAAGPDDGVGIRLAFVTPDGARRELDDWYHMVSRVGPHAADGSYARMEFDLGRDPSARAVPAPVADPSARPSTASAGDPRRKAPPAASTLVLEWSRREDAVALRVTAKAPGCLEVIGDALWGWEGRWEAEGGPAGPAAGRAGSRNAQGVAAAAGKPPAWRARLKGAEIGAVFAAGTEWCRAPDPGRGEVARGLDVAEGEAGRVAMVAVWGGADPAARAARLVDEVDRRVDRARTDWRRRRPRAAAHPGLVESIADNLMWMVLLQPETGRLFTPAGRRWIFPRPPVPGGAATREPDDWTIFGWDTFFNALLLANVSGELAWSTLLAGVESRYPERKRSQLAQPPWRHPRPLPATRRVVRRAQAVPDPPGP